MGAQDIEKSARHRQPLAPPDLGIGVRTRAEIITSLKDRLRDDPAGMADLVDLLSAETPRSLRDEARREKDRKRAKRNYRRRKQTMSAPQADQDSPRRNMGTPRKSPTDSPLAVDSGKTKKEASRKGTRLGDGEEYRAGAREHAAACGLERFDHHWDEFVDYWRGIPGQRGVKLDWPATWRNRGRTLLERQDRPKDKAPKYRNGLAALAAEANGINHETDDVVQTPVRDISSSEQRDGPPRQHRLFPT